MNAKLEAVLARLIQRSPRGLSVTQASKLPFLVDLISKHTLGAPITSSVHQAWRHGVVTAEAWHALKDGGEGHFHVGTRSDCGGRWVTLEGTPHVDLTPGEREIVDFVYDHFCDLPQGPLGQLTKTISAPETRWGTNQEIPLTLEAFEALPVWPGEDEADGALLEVLQREARRRTDFFIGKEKSKAALARWAS